MSGADVFSLLQQSQSCLPLILLEINYKIHRCKQSVEEHIKKIKPA